MTDETPPESRTAYVSFTDFTGQQWLVWKVAEAAVSQIRELGGLSESPSLGKAWLVFLSSKTGETRRIAPVPKDWRKLPDADLDALVREAKPFQGRK